MAATYEVRFQTHFTAAHALREYKGATEPLHGHNFSVEVIVSGPRVDRAGMLVDFLDLKAAVDAEIARLNYKNLNEDVPEFSRAGEHLSPSAERIAEVLYKRIKPTLPVQVKLELVAVGEAPGCIASYRE